MASRMLLRTYRRYSRSLSLSSSLLTRQNAAQPSTRPSLTPYWKCNVRLSSTNRMSDSDSDFDELLTELGKHEQRRKKEKEERRAAALAKGEEVKEEEEDDEEENDYMGLGPIKDESEGEDNEDYDDDDDDDDEDDDEDDDDDEEEEEEEKDEEEEEEKDEDEEEIEKDLVKYQDLLKTFQDSGTFDEAYKVIHEIDQFEAEHFPLSNEYKVVGWLMNRLKKATGKERFMLLMKTRRALKQLECKEAFDPQDPCNWGVIKQEDAGPTEDVEQGSWDKEREQIEGQASSSEDENLSDEEDKEEIFSGGPKEDVEQGRQDKEMEQIKGQTSSSEDEDLSDKEEIFSENLESIDKEIKKKLAEMELSFGKQSRDLEEQIKELVEQRQSLTEKKKEPLYRKGFDAKLIDVNQTCKVTKGGQVHKYSAMVACGNFNGVVGYGKGKGPAVPVALHRAYVKSFQNLHYIERYKEHTIAHAIQAKFKKTKIYLWPGAVNTGMRANKTVQTILYLAGIRNVKSKVIGSRNTPNTVKALFKALNMIETPQDIQEKFGRSVVESYLLK